MSIQTIRQLQVTRDKLAILEESAKALRNDHSQDEHVKVLTLRSLKQLINQLKEEIARFEANVDSGEMSTTASRGI